MQGEGLNLSQLQVRMPSTVLGGLHTSRPFYQNCPPKGLFRWLQGGPQGAHLSASGAQKHVSKMIMRSWLAGRNHC